MLAKEAVDDYTPSVLIHKRLKTGMSNKTTI